MVNAHSSPPFPSLSSSVRGNNRRAAASDVSVLPDLHLAKNVRQAKKLLQALKNISITLGNAKGDSLAKERTEALQVGKLNSSRTYSNRESVNVSYNRRQPRSFKII